MKTPPEPPNLPVAEPTEAEFVNLYQNAPLKISVVAQLLSVSVSSVRKWTIAGHLRAGRTPGGQLIFDRTEVAAFRARLFQGKAYQPKPQLKARKK